MPNDYFVTPIQDGAVVMVVRNMTEDKYNPHHDLRAHEGVEIELWMPPEDRIAAGDDFILPDTLRSSVRVFVANDLDFDKIECLFGKVVAMLYEAHSRFARF